MQKQMQMQMLESEEMRQSIVVPSYHGPCAEKRSGDLGAPGAAETFPPDSASFLPIREALTILGDLSDRLRATAKRYFDLKAGDPRACVPPSVIRVLAVEIRCGLSVSENDFDVFMVEWGGSMCIVTHCGGPFV